MEGLKWKLINDKTMYRMVKRAFPDLPTDTDYVTFLDQQYEILKALPLQSYKIYDAYGPYNIGQSQCLEMIFRSPLNTISKNFKNYTGVLKNVNSIHILQKGKQTVYLIEIRSFNLDETLIRYFNNPDGVWTYPGASRKNIKIDSQNEEFRLMCDMYGYSKQCKDVEKNYTDINLFLSKGIENLYVVCATSILYRDRLIVSGFKLIQYNTSKLSYNHDQTPIPPFNEIKNKPKNIVTYFDYINGGRKPPVVETIDGPVSYYYLENANTGVKMLLLGDFHVRNKTAPCPSNEQIYPLIDYLRVVLDYATKVQNIVIDVFLESNFGAGAPSDNKSMYDGNAYINIIEALFSTCLNAGYCDVEHRIHAVDIRPKWSKEFITGGFKQKFLNIISALMNDSNIITAEKLYSLINSYVLAYPYLTDPVNDFLNVGKLQKQLANIQDKKLVTKLLSLAYAKFESIKLSWKEIVVELCENFIAGKQVMRRKLLMYSSVFQDIYFLARVFRNYKNSYGLYSEKPCNIIHYAGAAHIESLKNNLTKEFGYKIINSSNKFSEIQCISLREMKQPLFHNSVCKNTDNLRVQEVDRDSISREDNLSDWMNAEKRAKTRYNDETLEIIRKIDSRPKIVEEKHSILYDAGFDEPFFFDDKYLNRVIKEPSTKAIRTLCFAYRIQTLEYNVRNLNHSQENLYAKLIAEFLRDPEVYVYPSMNEAYDEIKRGFLIKRKSIRYETSKFPLYAVGLKWGVPAERMKDISLKELQNIVLDKTDELYKINYPFFTQEDKEYDTKVRYGSSLYLKTLARVLNINISNPKNIGDIRSHLLYTVTYMLVKPPKV